MVRSCSRGTGIAVWLVPSEPESALLQRLMSRHPEPGAPRSFPHFHPHITLAAVGGGCGGSGTLPRLGPITGRGDDEARNSDAAGSDHSPGGQGQGQGPGPDPSVLLALREAIPLGQRAVHVRFARALAGDHYFRSIYVAIAPSAELAQLRAALALAPAAQGGGGGGGGGKGPDSPPAFPHLSLYYVADEEAHARARFLQELEREDVVRHSADGLSVALRCAAGEGEDEDGGASAGAEGDGVLESCICTQIWIVDCEGPVEGWKVLDKILLAK